MHHPIIVAVLLGLAALVVLLSSLGLMVMRDPYQRLHFPALSVSWGSIFIAAAVWVDETDPQARIKVLLIGSILFVMNAVLTNATAKAIRVHRQGHWEPRPEERIEIVGKSEIAGTHSAGPECDA